MLHNDHQALVVDPGDASPVLDALQGLGVTLETILVTHDHTDGVDALRAHTGYKVFVPTHEPIPESLTCLSDGRQVLALGHHFQVFGLHDHAAIHIADERQPINECPLQFGGDTLFNRGCGRLFKGTPAQSLNLTSTLPDVTGVCCAHEYAKRNRQFPAGLAPNNDHLADYMTMCQAQQTNLCPSRPSTIRTEELITPFLRTRETALAVAAQTFDAAVNYEISVFAALRH